MMLVLSGLAFASALFAIECTDESSLDSSERILQYTVTVYRDDTDFDTEKWAALTQDAHRAIEYGRGEQKEELVDAVIAGLKNMNSGGKGIYGDISISVSSGSCDQKKCCKECECAQRYRSMCPCPNINAEDCNGCCSEEDMKSCMQQCTETCNAVCNKECDASCCTE